MLEKDSVKAYIRRKEGLLVVSLSGNNYTTSTACIYMYVNEVLSVSLHGGVMQSNTFYYPKLKMTPECKESKALVETYARLI